MIHPTSIGGEVWYLSVTPQEDPRFNSHELTGNYTDGFACTVDPCLMQVETSMGYNIGSVRPNVSHSFISQTGFMYKSNDWRDCEMTGLFDCSQVTNENARIQFFARSAEIADRKQWCPGSFYMGELAMDGRFRWVKGQYHLSYESKDWISASSVGLGTNLITRQNPTAWFGLKIVMNNEDIGDGQQGVRLWAYVDKQNNNKWTLITASDILDNGGWGKDGEYCQGNKDQIITWGGPLASFRLEGGASQILFKKLSVREIDVGGQFLQPDATPQTAYAAAQGFQRVLAMSIHRYRIGTFVAPTCAGEIPTDPDPPDPPDPPQGGNIFVQKRLAHKYTVNSARTSVVSIDEFPAG